MSSYNVKLYEYGGTRQIRRYGSSIIKKDREYVEQYDMEYTPGGGYVLKKQCVVDVTPKEKRPQDNGIKEEENSGCPEFWAEKKRNENRKRAKNKIYEISRANDWEWFITLTFNPVIIDSTDYDRVKYVTSDFFHLMRKKYAPDLKYLIVPELHLDGKKYHFHGILSNIGRMPMHDSGLTFHAKTVYNLLSWHFGFSTATKVTDTRKVASYITKYITKELCAATDGRHRYLNSSNCNRPHVIEYNMSTDEYLEALEGVYDQIGHVKTVKIPWTKNKVEYIEIDDF